MKLEEAKLCMRCGEVFDVPTPGKCPRCNEDSWIWVLAFIKEELKTELFKAGILYFIPDTVNLELHTDVALDNDYSTDGGG